MMFGTLPSLAKIASLATVSWFPEMSIISFSNSFNFHSFFEDMNDNER